MLESLSIWLCWMRNQIDKPDYNEDALTFKNNVCISFVCISNIYLIYYEMQFEFET